MSHQPSIPQTNKWLRPEDSISWWVASDLWGMFSNVVTPAFCQLKHNIQKRMAVEAKEKDTEPSGEMSWHRVAGIRLETLEASLQSTEERFIRSVLLLVLTPFRFLSASFMQISMLAKNYTKSPPLFNLLWGPTSILTMMMQHYSALLTGKHHRLKVSARSIP